MTLSLDVDYRRENLETRRALIVHAHCYQPPREDPWLEVVEAEPSAAPDHDWNARIDRECYARLAAATVRARDQRALARDPDARSGIARLVNLYAWCSFDAGATLCEWLDAEAPSTFAAMRVGDAASLARVGHGNAIASPYHHVILPLASRRDKVTEVRWGMADFRRRFAREPEGMWLPECAVDEETLDVLAQEGIQFTILAPYQVRGAPGNGLPVRWRGANGRSLAIIPYDGSLAGEVAFGGLLRNATALAARFVPAGHTFGCTTLATDGETFGHHHRGGDATLAEALALVTASKRAHITNGGALLEAAPPHVDIELVSPSSWSCAHGIERWRSDCGCKLDQNAHTSQRWRRPLREALEQLAARCHEVFEREGAHLFRDDPWAVRDAYGAVVANDGDTLADFARAALRDDGDATHVGRAQTLLELERAVMRTFTSCAWFFDDVARIETRQVLRYAARALGLSGLSARLESEFVAWLEPAVSNVPDGGNAGDLFIREALPHRDPAWRVAAACAALAQAGVFPARLASYDCVTVSRADAAGWSVTVRHRRTGQQCSLSATVDGTGPATIVTLSDAAPHAPRTSIVSLTEFPELGARALLLPTSANPIALA